jgi:hypothetical protein
MSEAQKKILADFDEMSASQKSLVASYLLGWAECQLATDPTSDGARAFARAIGYASVKEVGGEN